MTLTTDARTPTIRRPVRKAVFLPAVGLIVAAAAQIDAGITTNAFRSASPAPEDSLNFPWYGELAGQVSTWWSFTGLFLVIGFACFARSGALRHSRAGRAGAWAAVAGAALIVVANFMSAANADAMMDDVISKVIVGFFAGSTLLVGAGLVAAGVATLRSGTWNGVSRCGKIVSTPVSWPTAWASTAGATRGTRSMPSGTRSPGAISDRS